MRLPGCLDDLLANARQFLSLSRLLVVPLREGEQREKDRFLLDDLNVIVSAALEWGQVLTGLSTAQRFQWYVHTFEEHPCKKAVES